MQLIGYSLVSVSGVEVATFSSLPNPVRLTNNDIVLAAKEGEILSDGSRLLPVMRNDVSPGEWYKRLREEREVQSDQVVVTVIYSDAPDLDDMRAHMSCTPFQGRMALLDANLLTQVEAAINSADQKTQTAWEYALEWKRNSPLIATLAAALNLSDVEVDDLFKAAQKITV